MGGDCRGNSPASCRKSKGKQTELWRDFLRRQIRIGFSQWSALIFNGAIWGLWHISVIVL